CPTNACVLLFGKDPQYNALTRTTSAVTMAGGSPQANVMPERAWAVINCRILPGETIDDVISHYRSFLPEEIEIKVLKGHNPPEIQSIDTKAYETILKVLNDMYPGAVLLPQMMAAGTDSRYYCKVCPSKSVYRFTGVLNDGKNGGTHSVDEHIAVDILSKNVEFYVNLIKAY
ncbi:MAG: M20/M25/M40 family metallo-hydrolase, partial [Clostridia bacterium]|nr:M20/M25/M40 family metallo-hydrolase [Clostridia bacterium]